MKNTRRTMPPARWLYVFEAAAKHENFTKAAEETFVTQAAVSKTIKSLEAFLDCQLFARHGRTVKLTPQGKDLYQRVHSAFDYIEDACRRLRTTQTTATVTILANTAVSHYYLGPKLRQFAAAHPHIAVRLISSDREQDWLDSEFDLAVVYDDAYRMIWELHPLLEETLYPVASRQWLIKQKLLNQLPLTTDEILALPILEYERKAANWNNFASWLSWIGEDKRDLQASQIYSNYDLAVAAMQAGEGIVLISEQLSPTDSEDFIPISDQVMQSDKAYYLGHPQGQNLSLEAQTLKNFLLQ